MKMKMQKGGKKKEREQRRKKVRTVEVVQNRVPLLFVEQFIAFHFQPLQFSQFSVLFFFCGFVHSQILEGKKKLRKRESINRLKLSFLIAPLFSLLLSLPVGIDVQPSQPPPSFPFRLPFRF